MAKTKLKLTTERVTARPTNDFWDDRAGMRRKAGVEFLTSKEYAESLGEDLYDVKPWGEGDGIGPKAAAAPEPKPKPSGK